MQEKLNQEARQYFHQATIFSVIADKLWHNYYLKQNFGLKMTLSSLSKHKSSTLIFYEPYFKFMGIPEFDWHKQKTLQITQFQKALLESKFHLTTEDFIKLLIDQPLMTKIEQHQKVDQAYQAFLVEIETVFSTIRARLDDKQLKAWFLKYQKNGKVKNAFEIVQTAIDSLPKDYLRLPVFAYNITGNPHAFDSGVDTGILLRQILTQTYLTHSHYNASYFSTLAITEQENEIFSYHLLLKDDIMNFVAINGLTATKHNQKCEMWESAASQHLAWNVPLKEVLTVETITPYSGTAVVLIENSGIYSILLESFPNLAIICTNGQFRYSVWVLIRKLVASNTLIYYAGDLDVEGILMADRLILSFPNDVQLLCMDNNYFEIAKMKDSISETRIKKLDNLTLPQLIEVGKAISESQSVAYQEGLIEELKQEIQNTLQIADQTRYNTIIKQ